MAAISHVHGCGTCLGARAGAAIGCLQPGQAGKTPQDERRTNAWSDEEASKRGGPDLCGTRNRESRQSRQL